MASKEKKTSRDIAFMHDWLEPDLQARVFETLQSPMPRGRGNLSFRSPVNHLDKKEVNGKRHLVFVSYYPAAGLVRKSIALRRTGQYYVTLIGCCLREDSKPFDYFDQVYEAADYRELTDLLLSAAPYAVVAHIHPWMIGLAAVSAGRMTGTPVVVDINDSMVFMEHDPLSPLCRIERHILDQASLFLHKMPKRAIADMRAVWRLNTPDIEIQSLPCREHFHHPEPRSSGEPLKVVFAGGIMPYHLACMRGHEEHIFDPVIHAVCQTGARLSFYVNQNARDMFWHEHQRYMDFGLRYEGFEFLKGIPWFELPGVLCRHHVGIHYENSGVSKLNPKHFIYNMATKIFSYLEAGLPVLVPEKAETMRDFVEEHGIGIAYNIDSLPGILDRLRRGDTLNVLTANVMRFRENYELNGMADHLVTKMGMMTNHE